MKRFLKKYWTLIGFISAFIIDHSFGIMQGFGVTDFWSDFIKGIGTIVYGYYFTSSHNAKTIMSQENIGLPKPR